MKDNIDRRIITALDYCIMVEKAKGHADEEQTEDTAFEEARTLQIIEQNQLFKKKQS